MVDLATVLPGDPRVVFRNDHAMLICAKWQDVVGYLPTVSCVITDPPYSERTHARHNNAAPVSGSGLPTTRRAIVYDEWACADVAEAVAGWASRCSGWIVAMSDSGLWAAYRDAAIAVGRVGFQPVPCVIVGMTCRFAGDGPSSWAIYANVMRPKGQKNGTLPGAYIGNREDQDRIGGKPLWLMHALISDYSREGDLTLDPCAGGCTTGVAAIQMGRQAILVEMDPATCAKAIPRLRDARRQLPLPLCGDGMRNAKQGGLDL